MADAPPTALRGLLLDLFEASALRRFIRDRWPALHDDLPGDTCTRVQLADAAARELVHHISVDDLARALTREFPLRTQDIEACAAGLHDVAPFAASPDGAVRRRLRTAFAAKYAFLPLIGLPHRGARPAVRLQDVCVPLRMRRGESVVPWTVPRLVGHLLGRQPAARVVVLGDPGSGKSTLCQYLTILLAGGFQLPGLELPELVPLPVRLRDFTDRSDSLLQHVRGRAEALGVDVELKVLTRACDEGRAVLIVDGLDEGGDAAARTELRGQLTTFLELHPRVSVLVSTREVGYRDVPLPDRGPDAFLELEMAPLGDEEIAAFAERWYAATEPTPDHQARGAADLTTSILAAPAVRALAGNRLLLTLLALIHRQDARLPDRRTALFERCVQLFLETWPKLRNREFAGLSPRRQRRLLETLAAALIVRRQQIGRDDLRMVRDGLITALVAYWRAEDPALEDGETTISAWIDHLHDESGLLMELGPGIHQFVHRSVQEYLAACWYARTNSDPVGLLVARLAASDDDDVWRMLAGLHAADRDRADELFRRTRADNPKHRRFLLHCLDEGVGFSPDQVAEILADALSLLRLLPFDDHVAHTLARLWRVPGRHNATIRGWFARGLARGPTAPLPLLVRIAAAEMPVEAVLAGLDSRPDRDAAAATLAPGLWPVGQEDGPLRATLDALGRWAWSSVNLEGAIALIENRRITASRLRPAAVMLLQTGLAGPVAAAVTLQLAFDALTLAHATATSPAWREVGAIQVVPGGWTLPTILAPPLADVPSGPLRIAGEPPRRSRVYPHGRFNPALHVDGGVDLDTLSSRFEGVNLFGYLVGRDDPTPDDFWTDATVPYGLDCYEDPDEYGDYAAEMPGNDYPLKEFERDVVGNLEPGFTTIDVAGASPVPPPDTAGPTEPYTMRARLLALRPSTPADGCDERALADLAGALHALHAAHATIAARSFPKDRALATFASEIRQQSAWVLQNWHALEEAAPVDASPLTQALVLALGWTQCLTTGTWPGTPSWRALLADPPPTHWWPRLHWHLCWSTARPGTDEHRAAVHVALVEGLKDPELGTLARRWSLAASG